MNKKSILTLTAAVIMGVSAIGASACGSKNVEAGDRTAISFFPIVDSSTSAAYKTLVDTYNAGQGVEDGVYVSALPSTSDYSSTTTQYSNSRYQVAMISDQYFKNVAKMGYLVNIGELMEDDSLTTKDAQGNTILDFSDISDTLINRFRINAGTGKQYAGEGQDLYGIPNGDNPTVYYYNAKLFADQKINVISVAEENLEAYNAANGTDYAPHGYAEYLTAPAEGLLTSSTRSGETVCKVFNNLIPMSWDELIYLSKYFTETYNSSSTSTYGFFTEWWFSFGWSVGGDCIGYNSESGSYEFTLGDDSPNYLVTSAVQINGNSYAAGELLSYTDKQNVSQSDLASLYELPSTKYAFTQFCALPMAATDTVTAGMSGYAISPKQTTVGASALNYFNSSRVAILHTNYQSASMVTLSDWDVAPAVQYREYEGGAVASDGNLKIIGKTYDGSVYSGELKTVNGTEIKGYEATASISYAYVIPKSSGSEKQYKAAYKFIQWAAGPEGQKIIATGNYHIPNQISYATGVQFTQNSGRIVNNLMCVSRMAQHTDIGDWAYLENQEWVTMWSGDLNSQVRNGKWTIDTFFNTYNSSVNAKLKSYNIVINSKKSY